jgi:hypothetical protein
MRMCSQQRRLLNERQGLCEPLPWENDAPASYKVQIQFAATSERVIKSEITLGAFTAAGCAKSRAPRRIAFLVLGVNFAPISAGAVQSNASLIIKDRELLTGKMCLFLLLF